MWALCLTHPATRLARLLHRAAVTLQLPAWGVIVLGCYALYCIGLGLYNFGDPGSAAEDLQQVRALRGCGGGSPSRRPKAHD